MRCLLSLFPSPPKLEERETAQGAAPTLLKQGVNESARAALLKQGVNETRVCNFILSGFMMSAATGQEAASWRTALD
jgi:hypothetical protein